MLREQRSPIGTASCAIGTIVNWFEDKVHTLVPMINTHLKQGDDEFERMRVFCTLRHFPDLKTSLAKAPKLTIPRALSRDELRASKKIPRMESTGSKRKTLNKLCGSALNDIENPYHTVKAHMRIQRDQHRHSQMSQQFQEGRSYPIHPAHQQTISAHSSESPANNALFDACDKLSKVGISFGPGRIEQLVKEGVLEREVASSGLLSVLGLPMYINPHATVPAPNSRPLSSGYGSTKSVPDTVGHDRVLSERVEIILGVRLEPDEAAALHKALYAHLR